MNRIDIQLIVHPNSKLTAIDDFSYFGIGDLSDNLQNYISVEFLEFVSTHTVDDKNTIIVDFEHRREQFGFNSEFVLSKDGMWKYYKFMIPTLDYLFYDDDSGVCVAGQVFEHAGKFYYFDKIQDNDKVWSEYGRDVNEVKKNILQNSTLIHYTNLSKYTNSTTEMHSFYCEKIVFSICNLTKCFVNLHHQMMENTFRYKCSETAELKQDRDFLLCSIHVLDYLKDMKEFDEAQRILDQLTSCSVLCTNSTSCNCYE